MIEAWHRLSRVDRIVYGAALGLVVLSFLPHVPAPHGLHDKFWVAQMEKASQELILGLAVLFVLGWEVAKAGYKTLSEASPTLVGVFVAVPVALPLTALAAWLAKLLEPSLPEHPLFAQIVPVPVGVGVTVYLVTSALVVVGLKELREKESP